MPRELPERVSGGNPSEDSGLVYRQPTRQSRMKNNLSPAVTSTGFNRALSTFMRAAIAAALVFGIFLVSLPARAQLSTNMQEWMRRLNSPEFRSDDAAVVGAAAGRDPGGGWTAGAATRRRNTAIWFATTPRPENVKSS